MFMAIGVAIFLLTYILPKFTPIFRSRGTELPTPTKVMMGISDALLNHWYFWLAGVVLLIAAYLLWASHRGRTPDSRHNEDPPAHFGPLVPQGDHQSQYPHVERCWRAESPCSIR